MVTEAVLSMDVLADQALYTKRFTATAAAHSKKVAKDTDTVHGYQMLPCDTEGCQPRWVNMHVNTSHRSRRCIPVQQSVAGDARYLR